MLKPGPEALIMCDVTASGEKRHLCDDMIYVGCSNVAKEMCMNAHSQRARLPCSASCQQSLAWQANIDGGGCSNGLVLAFCNVCVYCLPQILVRNFHLCHVECLDDSMEVFSRLAVPCLRVGQTLLHDEKGDDFSPRRKPAGFFATLSLPPCCDVCTVQISVYKPWTMTSSILTMRPKTP